MQSARHCQDKFLDGNVEWNTVLTNAVIGSTHSTYRSRQGTATGVFECFARTQQGLLPDDAQATNFLDMLLAVGNDPVPADYLRGMLTLIGDTYCIGKHELLFFRFGLFWQILWSNCD